jgi:hypothetical protein
MPTLQVMLAEADEALLEVLVSQWGVDVRRLSQAEIREALGKAMLDHVRVEKVFDALDSDARGLLQTLAGNQTNRNRIALQMFEALSGGTIRRLGKGQIEQHKPHINPANAGEALYYKGLVAIASDRVGGGIGFIAYIPDELAAILPLHKTGYSRDVLEAEAQRRARGVDTPPLTGGEQVAVLDSGEIEEMRAADTRIVDDMTTLLAYLQLSAAGYHPEQGLDPDSLQALMPHLLWQDEARLAFMVEIGISAHLIHEQEGRLYTDRDGVRPWLQETRVMQLHRLVEAWRDSEQFLELYMIPGLIVEDAPAYDAASARAVLVDALRAEAPHNEWWALDSFIEVVYARYTDFQRIGGDYDSWYIRNASDEYLRGVESWHAVDGAVVEFVVMAPLHWLGLLDVAENAARFNAYGRSLLDNRWQPHEDTEEPVTIQDDGTLLISRKVARYDRFQLARFTSWVAPATLDGNPYVYRLDAAGVQRAAAQNISTENIAKFVTRVTGVPLPEPVLRLLQNWRTGPTASVSLESHIILRTTAPETLDMIFNEPTLRRYLGARLGDMACIVRADQWEALTQALGQRGIGVDRGF